MRNENFVDDEYYHIYNRGADRRNIFSQEEDTLRFLESIRVFNTTLDIGDPIPFNRRCRREYPTKDRLVDIPCFSLMPNHYHMIQNQKQQDGIPTFMQRFGTSYTKYFNKQEQRTGCLFESVFKGKHINSEAYLLHSIRYIHLNPLGLIGMDWKTEGVLDKTSALNFLKSYRWSSFYYYFNRIESAVFDLTLLNSLFPSPEDHIDFMFDYQPSQQLDKVDFF